MSHVDPHAQVEPMSDKRPRWNGEVRVEARLADGGLPGEGAGE